MYNFNKEKLKNVRLLNQEEIIYKLNIKHTKATLTLRT